MKKLIRRSDGLYFKPREEGNEEGTVLYKKGGKIHIKPSRRGSFTRWCGGKVTEECIRRGKASKDPRIRRKAVFAENARSWHK